jgi:aryl-alcohol dehydrogenase-like predicted oxidoreductase
MQLTMGNGFGPPRDRAEADAVLKRAVELGVTLIDTADAYGPWSVEELIAAALHPYRDDLLIATKGGFVRDGNGRWITNGRPSHLREALEGSLSRLRLDTIDLYQLHRVDAAVPLEDQLGTLADLHQEGKIRHIGLSEVTVSQLSRAEAVTPIATVQNLFNLADRKSADVLEYATDHDIGFIPWFPLATGGLTRSPRLNQIAARQGISASQVALAWLLQHSDNVLPIPGTSQVAHLEDNVAAASIRLDVEDLATLDRLA